MDLDEQIAARAAHAAAARPTFLGWVLKRYQELEKLDNPDLAAWLGVETGALSQLALCRLPRPEQFAADIGTITKRCNGDPYRLAAMIRTVQALESFAGLPSEGFGVLAAARENDVDPTDEIQGGNET